MPKISRSAAFAHLQEIKDEGKGRVFSVQFTKKNGEERTMLCRFGVKSYLKGGEWANGNAGEPVEHGLMVVFDVVKKGYRSVPISRLHRIKHEGQELTVG